MRVTVFGATGRTGKEVVKQALEHGHEVVAFVRSPNKLGLSHQGLVLVQGDVRDLEDVRKAVAGSDVVVSCLGVPLLSTPISAPGTRNIVGAMESLGVKRLIVQSAYGAGHPRAGVYGSAVRHILRAMFQDKEEMEQRLAKSAIDFTVVRPTRLTNGPRTGNYSFGTDFAPNGIFPSISRANVADFMVRQIADIAFIRKAVNISAPQSE